MLKKDKTSDAKDPMAVPADLGFDKNCKQVVDDIVKVYSRIDILVNNAAEQYESSVEVIDEERLLRACFEAHEGREFHYKHNIGECILDYTATKGAIVAFTRGLSLQLVNKGIRVNGVAPEPIWTPLIPASFDKEETAQFGNDVPMKRADHPIEVAPCYVFLACNVCSSYITGQVLHLMAAS
ncbi:hypothetical protein Godav_028247 [Gossypium davidsonii]|uniref:Uncharacterized protein n=2 Tax=Gossypium TaxID=3633 RepID=A0A7J8RYQ4_GOSDV|nr:hypothetical protein [Gossypium davidsonii]MBA0671695.1 hypothetical protein [Gossypium klotzschianum]